MVASPLVSQVGLIGKTPPKSWGSRAIKARDAAGFDVVVGPGPGLSISPDGQGDVTFAGMTGLAKALAVRLDGPVISMDRTITSEQSGEGTFALFPAPIGAVRRSNEVEGVGLCPVSTTVAGVVVCDAVSTLAIVDDVLFASGVCLAAGALLIGHRGPVWESAEEYLTLVESMGLVSAEAVSEL